MTSYITNQFLDYQIQKCFHLTKFLKFYSSSGVPQVLPLLFNIFINDLSFNLHYAKLFSFSDDYKLLGTIKSVYISYVLQCDINAINK